MKESLFRKLVNSLLHNENGISAESYELLTEYAHSCGEDLRDIWDQVDATNDCFYLPDNIEVHPQSGYLVFPGATSPAADPSAPKPSPIMRDARGDEVKVGDKIGYQVSCFGCPRYETTTVLGVFPEEGYITISFKGEIERLESKGFVLGEVLPSDIR